MDEAAGVGGDEPAGGGGEAVVEHGVEEQRVGLGKQRGVDDDAQGFLRTACRQCGDELRVDPRRREDASTSAPSSGSSPAVPLLTARPVRRAPPRTPFAGPTGPVGRVSRAPAHDSGQPNVSFTSARCSRSSAAAQDRPPCLDSWPHRYSGLSRNSRLKPLNRGSSHFFTQSEHSSSRRRSAAQARRRSPAPC